MRSLINRPIRLDYLVLAAVLFSPLTPAWSAIVVDPNSVGATDVGPSYNGVDDPWDAGGPLVAGGTGFGELTINGGSSVSSTLGNLGQSPGSSGAVAVTGAGSTWANSGGLAIGGTGLAAGGNGALNINNSGLVEVNGTLDIWNTGSLNIDNGGLIGVPADAPVAGNGYSLNSAGDISINSGTVQFNGGESNGFFDQDGGDGGVWSATAGTIDLSGTTLLQVNGGRRGSGGPTSFTGAGGTWILAGADATITDTAAVELNGGEGGRLVLQNGSNLDLIDSATISLRGGNGGSSQGTVDIFIGLPGLDGGSVSVDNGQLNLNASSVIDLSGGDAGVSSFTTTPFPTPGGGGGSVAVTTAAGQLTLNGGTILVAGGDGVTVDFSTFQGPLGPAGDVTVTDGTLTLNSGLISGLIGASVADPVGMVDTVVTLNNAAVNLNNNLTIDNATLAMNGGQFLGAGQTINLTNGGAFNFNGGTLHIGTINGDLGNPSGTLAPGTSPGLTSISGSYQQGAGGTLEVELAGSGGIAGTDFDRVDITGDLSLAGTLDVRMFGGFNPLPDDQFDIVTFAGTRTGVFETVLVPSLGTVGLGLNYNTNSITLTAGQLGDLDGDGFVGINDINLVLGSWNQNVPALDLAQGDATGDGFVGIEDLNVVLGWWNSGTPPPAEALVPEPGTVGLLAITGGVIGCRRKRSQ